MTVLRCRWPKTALDVAYHDTEWGVPVHDDPALFELLTLEGAQAGLSWSIILGKRANDRRAFASFDVARVARFSPARIERLLEDPGLVRNRPKVGSAKEEQRRQPGCPALQLRDASRFQGTKALFMTVWRPRTRSAENSYGIRQG